MPYGKKKNRVPQNLKASLKVYFDTYADAQMWLENTSQSTDNQIRLEDDGRYVIFIQDVKNK